MLAQVAAVATLLHGDAALPVANSSREPVTVTVQIVHDTLTRDHIGRAARALVSPAAFTLAPGDRQVVRLRLKEPAAPGTLLRAVWTFTPAVPAGQGSAARVRLTLVTRFVSKLWVSP